MKKKFMEEYYQYKGIIIIFYNSHVVHGYVGNKVSVFPLQLHGFFFH
jgi:hypothetical protein